MRVFAWGGLPGSVTCRERRLRTGTGWLVASWGVTGSHPGCLGATAPAWGSSSSYRIVPSPKAAVRERGQGGWGGDPTCCPHPSHAGAGPQAPRAPCVALGAPGQASPAEPWGLGSGGGGRSGSRHWGRAGARLWLCFGDDGEIPGHAGPCPAPPTSVCHRLLLPPPPPPQAGTRTAAGPCTQSHAASPRHAGPSPSTPSSTAGLGD